VLLECTLCPSDVGTKGFRNAAISSVR
jgi:hypothetical protein